MKPEANYGIDSYIPNASMHETYSRAYVELWRNHWWWQVRHRVVLRELDRWRGRRDNRRESDAPPALLDIGCAGGVAFDDWSKYADVYGIEPDAQLIDHASRWNDRIEHTAFDGGYEASRSYDIVLMLDVLEHIGDDGAALAKVFEILKPGGRVILTVPALPSLWSVHDEINRHFRRYTRRTLRDVIAGAGFTCREMRYLFGWSLPLVYARKWLARGDGETYAVNVPPRPINALMRGCSLCEAWLTTRLGCPVLAGSSLLAVFERPRETPAAGAADAVLAKEALS